MSGLTILGFTAKRLDEIVDELEAAYRDAFGQDIKTTPDTMFGKLIGIHAEREASLWELMEGVYNSQYPNSASGQSLSNIGQYTDVKPNLATRSTATVYLAGTNGIIIPGNYLISTPTAQDQFRFTSNVTLVWTQFSIQSINRSGSVATAGATAHGRTVGDYVFISGANQSEYNGLKLIATVPTADSFTYAVTGTPATPATGSLRGDPTTAGVVESVETGPIQALANTLTQIVNPIVGWSRVENALDADLGRNAETDAEFRIRRIATLKGLGAARYEAILGAVLSVDGITTAQVFVNDTDGTVSGRPPHSIEVLAVGGDNQDILDTVWNKKAAGIQAYGNVSGTSVDSQGNSHAVSFSRPSEVTIWVELDLIVDGDFPSDGEAQVEESILAFGETMEIGEDVIVIPSLIAAIGSVPGIIGVTVRIGTSSNPTLSNNITITETQIAVFDSSRIEIDSTS